MSHIALLRFLLKGNKTFFDVSALQQSRFLYSLPEPKNDIERSFLQYKCQNYFAPKWKPILLNLVSLFCLIPFFLFYIFRGVFDKFKTKLDAISDLNGMEEVVPDELCSRFQITYLDYNSIGSLCFSDVRFVIALLIYRFPACYFSLKTMAKIAQYSQLIRCYTPSCIISHLEYSFSSSVLTCYCNKKGVRHINVMHGEKLYNIVDSFFRFDECYVWGIHHERLFIDLRAEKNQFKIEIPPSLRIDVSSHINGELMADYKYYLADFTEDEIKGITSSLTFIKRQGKSVKYRFHPRYANVDLLNKYIDPSEVENPYEVSIIDSISNCKTAIGSYSTALTQAYCSGKNVVLDDMTYQHQYEKLKDLRYWLINEGCARLSSMQ